MNAATQYGVQIVRASNETEHVWTAVSVRHLTPSENRGRHAVYVDVIDEDGNRDRNPSLRIGYFDFDGDTTPSFKVLDKPETPMELGDGNVDLYTSQTLSVWLSGYGLSSDMVTGIHSRHADEPGPNGENWNSYGHHSFKIVFQRQRVSVVPPEPDEPTEPLPEVDGEVLAVLEDHESRMRRFEKWARSFPSA